MIALTGCLAVVLLALLLAPETPFARECHRAFVERPVRALSKFRVHHLIYAVILVPVMLSGGEFLALLGPEFFAAYAMELAIYIDAVVVSLLASAYASVRALPARARLLVNRLLRAGKPRSKRSPRLPQAERSPANDDDGHCPIAVTMAA